MPLFLIPTPCDLTRPNILAIRFNAPEKKLQNNNLVLSEVQGVPTEMRWIGQHPLDSRQSDHRCRPDTVTRVWRKQEKGGSSSRAHPPCIGVSRVGRSVRIKSAVFERLGHGGGLLT